MSTIKLHKVTAKPAGPAYDPSALYMEAHDSAVITNPYRHKAWRVYATSGRTGHFSLSNVGLPDEVGSVFASSSLDGNSLAAKAFDGIDVTSWTSAVNDFTTGCFIGKIYTDPVEVSELTLRNTEAFDNRSPIRFYIQYSDDSTTGQDGTWTTIHTVDDDTYWGKGIVRRYVFNQAFDHTHRAWRVYSRTYNIQGSQNAVGVAEIDWDGADASTGTIIHDTNIIGGSIADNTYDSNLTTEWASSIENAWNGVVWPGPVVVNKVDLTARDDEATAEQFPAGFEIQYSDNTTDGTDGDWWVSSTYYKGTTPSNSEVITIDSVNTLPSMSLSIGKHKGWRVQMYGYAAGRGSDEGGWGEVNLPTGGTLFKSSESNGTTASAANAVDSDNATQWNTVIGGDIGGYVGKIYPQAVAYPSATLTSTPLGIYTPTFFAVQYSDDTTDGSDGTWISVLSLSNVTTWGNTETRTYPLANLPQAHSGWRINVLDNNGGSSVQLSELVFSGGSGAGTAYADTTLPDDGNGPYTSDKAFDMTLSTVWSSNAVSTGTIGKVYVAPQTINGVSVGCRDVADAWAPLQSPKNFIIEYSDDSTNIVDGTWYSYMSVGNQTGWTQAERRKFFGPRLPVIVSKEELRLHVSTTDGSGLLSLLDSSGIIASGEEDADDMEHILEVANIAARDALTLTRTVYVNVVDATADPVISSGGATYHYDVVSTTFTLMNPPPSQLQFTTEDW